MSLSGYTKEDLLEELAKREEIEDSIQPLPVNNFTKLIEIVTQTVNDIVENGMYDDNDDEHYVYEAALEAVYGSDIFDKLNRITA